MFSVNEGIDVVVKPVARGYDAVLPTPVKTGIGNFFGNIADLWIAVNNFLQGKVTEGASDVGRVLVNSTVGIVGLIDVASDLGLEKHAEDFGQTLGKWGVGEGPYLFWPIIGPRNVRDTFGFAVDASADPVVHLHDVSVRNTLIGIRFIDLRASLLPADKVVEEAAFDKYNYIRDAYFQNRRNAVHDGNPPPLKEED
jgi:phospholipid-binding lipoprotein MlaA